MNRMNRHAGALLIAIAASACATGPSPSEDLAADQPLIINSGPYHEGIYDLVEIDGDSLPIIEEVGEGMTLVINRTWMRLTSFGTVEWYQYAEGHDGTGTLRIRTEQDGEWVRGSRAGTGSMIWGWVRYYVNDQLAESYNDPDSNEYRLTETGMEFLSTGSVYRKR